jgi:hypothetical protein
MHRSNSQLYSITLSTVKSRLGGISRPKVVAVLRLMKSENLLPAWISQVHETFSLLAAVASIEVKGEKRSEVSVRLLLGQSVRL